MTVLLACVKCGKPSPRSYCEKHAPKPWATSRRKELLTVTSWEEQKRRRRILKRYMNCCYLCGNPGNPGEMDVDHVIPLAEGGPDDESNLRPCHRSCHAEKHRQARQGGGTDPRTVRGTKVAAVARRARQSRPSVP